MSNALETLAGVAGLADIHDKVMEGVRLSFDDGLRLFQSRALAVAGGLANVVRERKNGNAAYFVRNMHLNPTNVCTVDCKFCGFYRPYKTKEEGWTWDLDRALGEVRNNLSDAITEVHIVGGHNPDYPYAFYLDLVRGIHELSPALHVKAFTCAEYDFFAKRFKKDLDEVIDDFKAAGVNSLPGGGAEVLVERVRRELYPKKISAERWLEVARATARARPARQRDDALRPHRNARRARRAPAAGCARSRTKRAASCASSRWRSTPKTRSSRTCPARPASTI